MSAEKTLELLKKLKEDPKAKELLDGLKNTAPADDVITCYAQIAAKLGYAITAEEIREVVNQEEARRKSETEKIASDMKALNDDDVENVAGGGGGWCWSDYWCVVFWESPCIGSSEAEDCFKYLNNSH